MPVVADAAVAIRGDLSRFSGDLKKAEQQTQSLGGKLQSALSPKALVGGLAGGFAVSQVVGFLGDAVQAAGVFEDTVSATSVIFSKEFTPALQEWAEEAHSAFGASTQDALAAANQIAVFGKSAGLAGQELVNFSTQMVQLGGDLASMFGGSTEEAITAVGAALRGESEPIRRYGVLLDDATLRQRAFKLGLIATTTQALLPQQRVLAAQAEIMAQTGDAQGDFERTSDGLMNTQRDLNAQLENLTLSLGKRLLPAMLIVTRKLNDLVAAVGDAQPVWDAFGFVVEKTAAGLQIIAAPFLLVKDAVTDLTDGVQIAGNVLEAEAARWAGNTRSFADGLTVAEPGMRHAANFAITEPTIQAVIDARQKAAAEAREVPGAISDAFISAQRDLDEGLDALKGLMETSLSDIEKIAHAKAILADPAIARGLLDERFDVRDATQQIVDEQTAILEGLESGAYDAAVDMGITLPEQLRLQENVIRQGMVDALRGARNVLAEGWVTPAVPAPRLLGGPMEGPNGAVTGNATTVNNNLTVNGVPYKFDNKDAFISALDNLSAFGDGRMPGGSR